MLKLTTAANQGNSRPPLEGIAIQGRVKAFLTLDSDEYGEIWVDLSSEEYESKRQQWEKDLQDQLGEDECSLTAVHQGSITLELLLPVGKFVSILKAYKKDYVELKFNSTMYPLRDAYPANTDVGRLIWSAEIAPDQRSLLMATKPEGRIPADLKVIPLNSLTSPTALFDTICKIRREPVHPQLALTCQVPIIAPPSNSSSSQRIVRNAPSISSISLAEWLETVESVKIDPNVKDDFDSENHYGVFPH